MNNETKLKKLDLIVERTDVSYAEAEEALDASDGDVIKAIEKIEEDWLNFLESEREEAWDDFKEKTTGYTKKKIGFYKDGEKIGQIPLLAGAAALAATLAIKPLRLPGVAGLGIALLKGVSADIEDAPAYSDHDLVYEFSSENHENHDGQNNNKKYYETEIKPKNEVGFKDPIDQEKEDKK